MKPLFVLALLFLITILAANSHTRLLHPNPSWVVAFPSRNNHHRYHHQRRCSLLDTCRPSSHEMPRFLCSQLQRVHGLRRPFPSPPPPPPSSKTSGDEIDLRYGVEKRLVPSGPNPLHN